MSPYQEAESRYQGYRDAAYSMTWDHQQPLLPGKDLKLFPFDSKTLGFWGALHYLGETLPEGGFQWPEIYDQFRSTPRRFEVAVWDGKILCGLALGNASRGKQLLTIKWIERFPITEGGWVTSVILTAADYYGAILGCKELRIRNPVPGTEQLYCRYGFALADTLRGATYWARPVRVNQ